MLPFGIQEKAAAATEKGIAESVGAVKELYDKIGLREKTDRDRMLEKMYDDKSITEIADEHEAENLEAKERNPELFSAGELGGEALSATIPLGGAAKGVTAIAKRLGNADKLKSLAKLLKFKKAKKPPRSRAEIDAEFGKVGKEIRETLPLREAKRKRDLEKFKKENEDLSPLDELMDLVRQKKKGKKYIPPDERPTKVF
jgi:hypothetical protein